MTNKIFSQRRLINRLIIVLLTFLSSIATVYANDVENNYEKALSSYQQKHYSEAVIHLKNVIAQAENNLSARVLLIETFIAQGKGALAETELNYAKKHGVDENRLKPLYAKAYMLQAKYQNVVTLDIAEQSNKSTSANLLTIKGQAFLALGQDGNADNAFKQAIVLQPSNQLAELGRAQVAYNGKRFTQAMTYTDQALLAVPQLAKTWIMKSRLLELTGERTAALSAINKAILINPDHLGARMARALLYISAKSYSLAKQDAEFILSKEKFEPMAKYILAIVQSQTGDIDGAGQNLSDIINSIQSVPKKMLEDNPDYYYLAGLANYDLGRFNDARTYFNKFAGYNRHHIQTKIYLAEIELKNGFPASAKNILLDAKLLADNNFDVLTLLGVVYSEIGNKQLAKYYFERVLKLQPNSVENLVNLARSYLALKEYARALSYLQKASVKKPDNLFIKLLKINIYIKSNQLQKAKKIADMLVLQSPSNSLFQQESGIVEALLQHYQLALTRFNKAVQLDNNNIKALILGVRTKLYLKQALAPILISLIKKLSDFPKHTGLMVELGYVYQLNKNYSTAQQWFEKAYALDKDNFKIVKKLDAVYQLTHSKPKSISLLAAYIARFPKNSAALNLLSKRYFDEKQNTKGLNALNTAAKYSDTKGAAYMDLAQAQITLGKFSAAKLTVQKAIGFNDQLVQARILLIKLYTRKKDKSRALEEIENLKKFTPDLSAIFTLQGDLYSALSEYKLAKKRYMSALAIKDLRQALLGLYTIAKRQHRFNNAIKALTQWLKKYPQDFQIEVSLADSYKSSGKTKKAVKYYRKLLVTYSDNALLLNNLALVELQLKNLAEAKKLATKAHLQQPRNINYMDTLAWIESQMGEEKTALTLFREAILIDYEQPAIKYHLALTLAKLNRRDEAHKYLVEAIESGRYFDEKEQAKKLLKQWMMH